MPNDVAVIVEPKLSEKTNDGLLKNKEADHVLKLKFIEDKKKENDTIQNNKNLEENQQNKNIKSKTSSSGSMSSTSLQKIGEATNDVAYQMSNFIYAGIILFIIFLITRIVNKHLWNRYKIVNGRPAPQILITFINLCLAFCGGAFISVFIFKQSLVSLMTAGGVAGLGLTFALQGPILDFFSGIIMDLEGRVSNGDWIKLNSEITGQISGHNWRSISLLTIDNTLILVPNSKFIQSQFENISKKGEFWQTIKISIDYNISVSRAQRILESAISKSNGIKKSEVHVFADQLTEGGITYNCRYQIINYADFPRIRHDVIQHIIEHLHSYKLGVSETLGEYIISMRNDISPNWESREDKNQVKNILMKTPLLCELGSDNLEIIRIQSKIKHFSSGQDICIEGDKGDTMYIILEGFVDIFVEDKKIKKEALVASLSAPDYFGEMALFMGDKRRSTVRARTSLVVLEIGREVIVPILKKEPTIIENISALMMTHLEGNQQFLDDLSEKEPNPKPPLTKIIFNHILKIFTQNTAS